MGDVTVKPCEGFEYITRRAEWQVISHPVGQYGEDVGKGEVLARYPSRDAAVADLPKFGKEHAHVAGRWVPHDGNRYAEIQVIYREVVATPPAASPSGFNDGVRAGLRMAAGECNMCPDMHWGPWLAKRILALSPATVE